MEEYIKKQEQKKGVAPVRQAKAASKDISESSDKYTDDDFESISKSQSQSMPKSDKKEPSQFQNTRITHTYVSKENKFVQTDKGKYDTMGPQEGGYVGTGREWMLKRDLEDAELLIQQQKHLTAEQKDEMRDMREKLKKMEMDFRAAKREAMNGEETNNRLKEQLKECVHKINVYRIETEELIKQVDLADAKTRQKEVELQLANAEFDKKLQLQLERIAMRRSKNEERALYELKRKNEMEIDEMKSRLDEQAEEVDYYKTKVEKLEADNFQLKQDKPENKRVRELENEIELLKNQLRNDDSNFEAQVQKQNKPGDNIRLDNIKKNLSPDEQIQIQRELLQLDKILKGYQEENFKSVKK